MRTGHRWVGVAVAALVLGVPSAVSADQETVDRDFGRNGVVLDGDIRSVQGRAFLAPTLFEPTPTGALVGLGTGVDRPILFRLLPDGSLDASFGVGGIAASHLDDGAAPDDRIIAGDLDVGPDGHVVVVGSQASKTSGRWRVVVAVLAPDGSLATGFGVRVVDLASPYQYAISVEVDPTGRVVASVRVAEGIKVVRFLADGRLDRGFADGGARMVDASDGVGGPWSVLDGTRFVYLARDGDDTVLVRLAEDGTDDRTFGEDGRVVLTGPGEQAAGLHRGPDGGLYVWHLGRVGDRKRLLRFHADGRSDASFTSDLVFGPRAPNVPPLGVGGDGSVVVSVSDEEPIVARLTPDGSVDTAFGCGGRAYVDTPGRPARVRELYPGRGGDLLLVGDRLGPVTRSGPPPVESFVSRLAPLAAATGYRLVTDEGNIAAFGAAGPCPPATPQRVVYGPSGGGLPDQVGPSLGAVGIAAGPTPHDHLVVAADGGVFTGGEVRFHGSMGGQALTSPIVGAALDPDGSGYWLVGADGGVLAFDATFAGSMGGQRLAAPVVGMSPTDAGRGYWLVAADGGVFAFGDARFAGSMGGQPLHRPVVGMSAAGRGGYWLVASDGGVFAFGAAAFAGSTGSASLQAPVVGMAGDPDGSGYWLAAADGGVFAFDAPFHGSLAGRPPSAPVVAIASNRSTPVR